MTDARTSTETHEETDTASDPMRKLIYNKLYPDVEAKVGEGIEDEKNNIRNGKTKKGAGFFESIWAAIKGFLFQICEALGIEKQVAGFFGYHIPDASDKKAISEQVTSSVSDVLTAKDAEGKPLAARMTPEQLEEAVRERVTHDLETNGKLHLTPEQIAKIAAQAGSGAKENSGVIYALFNPAKPVISNVPLTGTPEQQVSQHLSNMADGITDGLLKTGAIPEASRADAEALKPVMVSVGTKVIMENKDLINNPDALADRYVDALQKNDDAKSKFQKLGLDISNPENAALVKNMMKQNLDAYKDELAKAAEGKGSTPEKPKVVDPLAGIDSKALVSRKIAEKIEEETANSVVETWREGGIAGWSLKSKEVNQAIDVYTQKYKGRTDLTPQEQKEKDDARHVLYQRAVEKGHAPNNEQRKKIGNIVAAASEEVLKDPANKDLSQTDLGDRMQTAIAARLKKEQPLIDALGQPVDDINQYYFRSNKDLLGDIAKDIGDTIRDPNDKNGVYAMIKTVQASMQSKVASAAEKIGKGITASTIKGGRDLPGGMNDVRAPAIGGGDSERYI